MRSKDGGRLVFLLKVVVLVLGAILFVVVFHLVLQIVPYSPNSTVELIRGSLARIL